VAHVTRPARPSASGHTCAAATDWSPRYDAGEDLAAVFASLSTPARRTAALRYYRALFLPWCRQPGYAAEQAHDTEIPAAPLLYLHGEDDGCLQVALAGRTARCWRRAAASRSWPAPRTSCTSNDPTR
jgi:hypothetical protein